jgi:hypothetical protein
MLNGTAAGSSNAVPPRLVFHVTSRVSLSYECEYQVTSFGHVGRLYSVLQGVRRIGLGNAPSSVVVMTCRSQIEAAIKKFV